MFKDKLKELSHEKLLNLCNDVIEGVIADGLANKSFMDGVIEYYGEDVEENKMIVTSRIIIDYDGIRKEI